MKFTPEITIGFWNAWWFVIAYILVNVIPIFYYPKHFAKRVFTIPKFGNRKERILSTLNFFFYFGAIGISIFLPLKLHTNWFLIGLIISIIGFILYTLSMINFATTPPDQPVTKGVYRISRNPMQVTAILIWIGVGITTASWIILLLCVLQGIFSYPSMIAQERFCIDKYGEPYLQYMQKSPRYLIFF